MESSKPIKLDWSRVDRSLGDELFRPVPDTRIPTVRLAQELERKMFTYMLLAGISKIYSWTETNVKDNIYSFTWRFDDVRPLNTQCTEHDFKNLIEMSDEEFNALPPSSNTGLVKSWREIMRNRNHD